MGRRQIDSAIPFIKEQGVKVLSQEYANTDEGLKAIEGLDSWYQEKYPDYYTKNKETVQSAVTTIKDIYTTTVFPNMGVGWQTHPNNLGHKEFPGCFRCHDGKHTSTEGQTVRLECNICHSIPEVVDNKETPPLISVNKPNEPESHLDSNWLARHRYQFDKSCAECHEVDNPGGTDNSSFCSNSGCHASEWKFAGLDAPAIRAMVEPPKVPGTGEPRPVPHPIGPRTDCKNCHGPDGVRPFPANHAKFDSPLCVMCHQPSSTETSGAVTPVTIPAVPHLVKDQEDQCLACHDQDALIPFPANHQSLSPDMCLLCHKQAELASSEAEGEKRPKVPHSVIEGWQDCLLCHNLEGIRPFPANHEGRKVEKCQNCHKPKE
jgi:formate-dependent nitrite reductase cytochrome c552 subunit